MSKINKEELPQEVRHLADKTKKELLLIIHSQKREVLAVTKRYEDSTVTENLDTKIAEENKDLKNKVEDLKNTIKILKVNNNGLKADIEGTERNVKNLQFELAEKRKLIGDLKIHLYVWFGLAVALIILLALALYLFA